MKILVGYDSSNAAREALSFSAREAKAFNAHVLLLTSLPGGTVTETIEIQYAKDDLEDAKKVLESKGISCETHLLIRGLKPGEDIVRFAEENNVDEIIIGVRRRSKVGKILFGSNAQYVVIKAHCPVISVK
ncbi:MAG: universal stress protein [Desulfobacterales bacterium]|nr:universal stress protein [Desulfobacterales bacterium]